MGQQGTHWQGEHIYECSLSVTRNTMNDTSYISGLFHATIVPSMHTDTQCQASRAGVREADFAAAAQ
jgi:hypothetical protein